MDASFSLLVIRQPGSQPCRVSHPCISHKNRLGGPESASLAHAHLVVRFFGGSAVFGGRFWPKGSDLESGIYTSVFGSSRNRRARWIRIHRCLTFERMGRSPIIFSPIQMTERLSRVVIARSPNISRPGSTSLLCSELDVKSLL